ncbi:hypothetical protein [Sphingosinicella sp. BN140058]|uniref:hypothetical protein n=1 Tax=Sphingosinicella sp. BN140058 TaxID=1892855 RepID=UPI0010116761|nr:hypothetical protein [Sphingosinicella sp. BN140058]QAY80338.1 hypothetical protein ETR14_27225 [Sphingosinicella sp. BN140058]
MSLLGKRVLWSATLPCAARDCQKRTSVAFADLFHLQVPGPVGGSERRVGFACARCGYFNPIPASMLPRGTNLASVPSAFTYMGWTANRLAGDLLDGGAPTDRWVTGEDALRRLVDTINGVRSRPAALAALAWDGTVAADQLRLSGHRLLDSFDRADCKVFAAAYISEGQQIRAAVFHCQFGALIERRNGLLR